MSVVINFADAVAKRAPKALRKVAEGTTEVIESAFSRKAVSDRIFEALGQKGDPSGKDAFEVFGLSPEHDVFIKSDHVITSADPAGRPYYVGSSAKIFAPDKTPTKP